MPHRYAHVGVEPLSHAQIKKLISGGRIKVKHGSHHKIHMTHAHHKKLMKAHEKGAGIMLELDPYACDLNAHLIGEGVKSVGKQMKHAFHKAGHFVKQHKEAFRPLASHLKQKAHESIAEASMAALEHGVNPELVSAYNQMAHEAVPHSGGSLRGFSKSISHLVKTPAVRAVRRAIKPIAQKAWNVAEDMALQSLEAAPMAMAGMGIRRKAPPKRKPKARKGGALYPAGMGFC